MVKLRCKFYQWVGVLSKMNLDLILKNLSNSAHHLIEKIYFQVLTLFSSINSFY
jgi:hypothetical protein